MSNCAFVLVWSLCSFNSDLWCLHWRYNVNLFYKHFWNVYIVTHFAGRQMVKAISTVLTVQRQLSYPHLTYWKSGYNTALPSSNVLTVQTATQSYTHSTSWLSSGNSPTLIYRIDCLLQPSPTVPTLAERVDCLTTTQSCTRSTCWLSGYNSLTFVQRVDCLATTQSYSAYTRWTCWLCGYSTVLHSYNVLTVWLQHSPTLV